ncbi:MAG: SurA N-terminal domain-containing protein [Candidatus Binatia bacterium]
MLKFIRRNAGATWVKFMFGAIVVVFIFWGMGGVMGGNKAQIVARVNTRIVDPTEYYRTYNNLSRLYRNAYKDTFTPELVKVLNLKQRTLDQIIQTTLLDQEARRLGLRVTETELRDSIATLPAFAPNGRFSKNLYLRTLRANNITPGEFEDGQRNELLVRKLQDLILAGVHVSDAELRKRYEFENEKVDLRFIKLDAATFVPAVTLKDADVRAYYDKHQGEFREPERLRAEYVLYAPDKFTAKVQLTDAMIQRYYDTHIPDFTKPERVHARHILFKVAPDTSAALKAEVRSKAEAVLQKVKAGGDFAALAREYSDDPNAAQGGDLGWLAHGKTVQPFEEAAFALAPGATSDIVESPFGFHIIKVEAKEEAHSQPLDEVRDQVRAALTQEQAKELARTQAEDDEAKVAAGKSLAAVAQAAGLSVATPPPFARQETIAGLDGNPDLMQAAFATSAGEVAPVVETPQGFVVLRVIEKLAAHVPPLADIHDRVESAARIHRAEELAKQKAEALLAEVQKTGFEAAAKANNQTIQETGPLTRSGGYVPNIGNAPELKKAAFRLTPQKPVAPAVYTVTGSSVLASLKEKIPAPEDDFAAEKDKLRRQIEQQRQQQVLQEFINHLKARATISVNRDFLASIPDTARELYGGRQRR